jgi:hypothetical protein
MVVTSYALGEHSRGSHSGRVVARHLGVESWRSSRRRIERARRDGEERLRRYRYIRWGTRTAILVHTGIRRKRREQNARRNDKGDEERSSLQLMIIASFQTPARGFAPRVDFLLGSGDSSSSSASSSTLLPMDVAIAPLCLHLMGFLVPSRYSCTRRRPRARLSLRMARKATRPTRRTSARGSCAPRSRARARVEAQARAQSDVSCAAQRIEPLAPSDPFDRTLRDRLVAVNVREDHDSGGLDASGCSPWAHSRSRCCPRSLMRRARSRAARTGSGDAHDQLRQHSSDGARLLCPIAHLVRVRPRASSARDQSRALSHASVPRVRVQ